MRSSLQLKVHGKGNAWPVPLGETHPYYDRTKPGELSNAAFSLDVMAGEHISRSILVDAGHGTIQSLITGSNRIPDCVCLTHGHMDHTLSVDWIVQSYWRKFDKERRYPIYCTRPVCEFFIRSYPHLADQVDFKILDFGKEIPLDRDSLVSVTAFPAYHGMGAVGASMLLFKTNDRKILFTGDLLTPLLRKEDYSALQQIDLLVVDTNNRFPWPRTNHWSFAGDPENHMGRSKLIMDYYGALSWDQMLLPHQADSLNSVGRDFLIQVEEDWSISDQPLSIMEFLQKTEPQSVMPVHYSGAEDLKYHGKAMLSEEELSDWIQAVSSKAVLKSAFVFPGAGEVINL